MSLNLQLISSMLIAFLLSQVYLLNGSKVTTVSSALVLLVNSRLYLVSLTHDLEVNSCNKELAGLILVLMMVNKTLRKLQV